MIGLGTCSGVAQLAREAQSAMEEDLKPCPFCEGPPVPAVPRVAGGGSFPDSEMEGDEGLLVRAYVFCHECGAEGPDVIDTAFSRADCNEFERKAVALWQNRDARHRDLYEANRDARKERMAELFAPPPSPDEMAETINNQAMRIGRIEEALKETLYWFQAEKKSISKGNDSQWSMLQCQEQIELIEAALKGEKP